jgi:UDP-N-acetylglucosamine acyltransferase
MDRTLANISPDAKIAENVVIEPFATVHGNVEIEEGCWIGPNAVIMEGSRIGKNCKIFPGAVIAGIPQDLKFKGEETTVEIGENTVVREYVTINRGTAAKGKTIIGKNCLLMSYVHVAHDCIVANNCILGSYAGIAGEVEVDEFAIISPGSLVHQFVRIGKHIMIQGGSKVPKDVPPYIMAGREPICFMGLNSVGLKRRKFQPGKIGEIQEMYRYIYQKSLNVTQALEKINEDFEDSPEKQTIIDFIKGSKRGIIRGGLGMEAETMIP